MGLLRVVAGLARVVLGWTTRLLLVLLVAIIATLGILLGTPDGIRSLVTTADRYIPGHLEIADVEGGLFGSLRVSGLRYRDEAMSLDVGALVLRWEPMALLHQRVHVVELSIADGRFEQLQPSEPTPESSEPVSPPDITLPVALSLDRVAVKNFQAITSPGAEPLVVSQLLLRATAKGSDIVFETLEVALPDVWLETAGRVQVSGDYPLTLHNDLKMSMTDIPKLRVQGEVSGSLRQLVLKQALSGDLDAVLDAEIRDPLEQLGWRTQVTLTRLGPELADMAGIALPSGLNAEISGNGDLHKADAMLQVNLTSAQGVDAEAAGAAHPAGRAASDQHVEPAPPPNPAFLKLTGSAQLDGTGFDGLTFNAKGQWQSLQWPLVGTAQVVSESGGLEVSGTAKDYRFSLDANIAGPDVPPGTWSLRGGGDAEQVQIASLHGEILDGTLDAYGRVAWAPQLEWQINSSGKGINPGLLAAEWPGNFDLALKSEGVIKADRRRVGVVIERLGGELRGLPLAGHGEFRLDGAAMVFNGIQLSSGSAQISADGKLDSQSQLEWNLQVPDLGDLLPDGRGRIQASGKLLGDMKQPRINASLVAEKVELDTFSLQQLEGDFDLDLSKVATANIRINGTNLGTANELVETLGLTVTGPLDAHQIRIVAKHPMAEVQLDASGALSLDDNQWRGQLDRLDLALTDWGDWRLKSPVTVRASPELAQISPLCLRDSGTELCSELDWRPGGGTAKATLSGFSLERLRPVLPEDVTSLSGVVHAVGKAALGPQLAADVQLTLDPGHITYQVDHAREIELSHRGGSVTSTLDHKQLAANVHLEVGQSGLDGSLMVPRAALDQDPVSAPLQGQLSFDFKELGLITAFVPAVEESEGAVRGKLTLGGAVGAPKIAGEVVLDMAKLFIPDLGLDLQDLKVSVVGDGDDRLRVDGGASSGPGRLDVNGEAQLDAAKGWPAMLTIKGDRFRAVNLEEATVLVSPDLSVSHDDKGLKVRGNVDIPEARIRLKELPRSARKVSSDLVIVSDGTSEEELQAGLPIDAKVTVRLGDDVHFRGFGVLAKLGGRITVTQEPGRPPVGHGDLGIVRGSVRSFGQELTINRGKLLYAGGSLTNPGLNIRASREVGDLTAGVDITGTAKKPVFKAFSSDPHMSEDDARSLLLTGATKDQASEGKGSLYAGTNITDKLSVGTNVSVDGSETEFVARYRLTPKWSIKTSSSSNTSGAEILYTIKFK
jgi:translocation and assembly module TamB